MRGEERSGWFCLAVMMVLGGGFGKLRGELYDEKVRLCSAWPKLQDHVKVTFTPEQAMSPDRMSKYQTEIM